MLYAYDSGSTLHLLARSWVEHVFSEGEPLGLPWQTVAAFLRVVTNPKLRGDRFTVEAAAAIVDQWLAQPNVRLLAPGERHWSILRPALVDGQVRGPLITDAQLARSQWNTEAYFIRLTATSPASRGYAGRTRCRPARCAEV